MIWGLYDTKDNCWIGTNDGPLLYDDNNPSCSTNGSAQMLARVAAQTYDVQVRNMPGRTRVKEYDGTGIKLKDEVKTTMTTEQALKHQERGGL